MEKRDPYRVGPADPEALDELPGVEVAAAAAFPDEDLAPELKRHGMPSVVFEQAAQEGRLFVAVRADRNESVGFVMTTIVDQSGHLFEMNVLPEHQRRGLGQRLVAAAAGWARSCGYTSLSLTTFRHLAWNAPFYRKLGFEDVASGELGSELASCLGEEAARGLDPEKRVAMRLWLPRDS